MGHLGERVSALLDGQLPVEEEERAWAHVHVCHLCRDLVEREGWVKTRLAGLSFDGAEPRLGLREELKCDLAGVLAAMASGPVHPGEAYLVSHHAGPRPRRAGMMVLGGGAVGAAVMGVLALGAAPADAPVPDRRVPATSVNQPVPTGLSLQPRRAVPLP